MALRLKRNCDIIKVMSLISMYETQVQIYIFELILKKKFFLKNVLQKMSGNEFPEKKFLEKNFWNKTF